MSVSRAIALLTVIACLCSCATSSNIEQALDNLIGENVRVVEDEMGAPDIVMEHAGVVVYSWTEVKAGAIVPSSTDHSGVSMGARPYRQDVCQLIVQASPDGQIIAASWTGRSGPCNSMVAKLVGKYSEAPAGQSSDGPGQEVLDTAR